MSAEVGLHYKQSELGLIPAEWTVKPISDCMRLINGRAFKPSEWASSGVPIIRIQNLNNPSAEFNYYPFDDIEDKHRIKPGDLVFAWSGTLGSSFGARSWAGPEGVLNQHIFKVAPDTKVISPEYALIVFKRIEDDIAKKAHGFKTSFVHIKKADLDSTFLPLPCHHEQKAIALALNDIEVLISSLDQLISKKRDIQQATMQQLLTGQRRLPGFSGEWGVKRLGDLCTLGMGRTPSRINDAYWGRGYKWLSIADLKGKVIAESSEEITELAAKQIPLIRKGTLLMSFKLSIGRLAFAGCDLFTNEAICSFNDLKANAEYLYYALQRVDFSLYGKQAVKGFTLNKASLQLVEVAIPTMEEQTAIANILSDMDAELAALEARRDKARHIKQGMMQELLTGRTRLI